jgi:hypothetical protein
VVIELIFLTADGRKIYKVQVIELAAISCHYPEIVRLCGVYDNAVRFT